VVDTNGPATIYRRIPEYICYAAKYPPSGRKTLIHPIVCASGLSARADVALGPDKTASVDGFSEIPTVSPECEEGDAARHFRGLRHLHLGT
jgi:hypothetical protein